MKTLKEIKKILSTYKEEIREKFKVKEIGIFGSTIKRKRKRGSDIDILVDFEEEATLFDLVGLSLFLEKKLKQKVDVVSKEALREELKGPILKELIPV